MSDSITLACITDPRTHPEFDTTFELYTLLAKDPRFTLLHIPRSTIGPNLNATFCNVPGELNYQCFLNLDAQAEKQFSWEDCQLVFCRSDKPLPDEYYQTLASLESKVAFVNSPSGLLRASNKIFFSQFAKEFLPDYITNRDSIQIEAFLDKYKKIVAKACHGYGGKDVYRIEQRENEVIVENISRGTIHFPSAHDAIENLLAQSEDDFQCMRYLKNVFKGDKRVLVVNGEVYGGYVRRSTSGSWIQNITSGAEAFQSEVTEHEREVVQKTWPHYQKIGVTTLGYDFLVDDDESWILSEINAGNIGGYGRLEKVGGVVVYPKLLQFLYDRATKAKSPRGD